jgi:hypothetical protein
VRIAYASTRTLSVIAIAAAGLLGACASTNQREMAGTAGGVVGGAIQQPFRDLSIIREQTAPILIEARDAPYDISDLNSCNAVEGEIAALDRVLGPDINTEVENEESAAVSLASNALEDVVGLPMRGVVRRISGAHGRDEEHRRAILAGMVRRGHLKGVAAQMQCFQAPQATTASVAATTP